MSISLADLNEVRRDFYIRLPFSTPHLKYIHTPPPYPAGEPALPDGLNYYELAAVEQWFKDQDDSKLYFYASQAKIAEFQYWWSTPEYESWEVANYHARKSQWHWEEVDAAILNYPTNSPTSKGTGRGTGDNPPPATIPKQEPQ